MDLDQAHAGQIWVGSYARTSVGNACRVGKKQLRERLLNSAKLGDAPELFTCKHV